MDELHRQPWWEYLTYITQQQLDELIRRYEKWQTARKKYLIYGLIGNIVLFTIFGARLRTLPREVLYWAFAFAVLFIVYILLSFSNTEKESYEKHRESIIKAVSGQFCTHGAKCDCKDSVARYFKEIWNINLMF
jgi:predicted tellurium resistance membrane protein TerC